MGEQEVPKDPKDSKEPASEPLVQEATNASADSTQEVRSIRRYSSKRECRANPFALRPGRELKWTNVNVQVARKEKAGIQVLQDISGTVQPRQLTCIMGHSGSGYVQLFKLYRSGFCISDSATFHSPTLYLIHSWD
jgi:ABC-type multidrug transport system fused ATPase/permease subunit